MVSWRGRSKFTFKFYNSTRACLSEVVKCTKNQSGLYFRHVVLVTDDRDSETLVKLGHMNHVVKRAIEEGTDPIVAIQATTINTAEHYNLANHLGSKAPSKIADLLILDDIKKTKIGTVIVNGRSLHEMEKHYEFS